MQVAVRHFSFPKIGSAAHEYEDAFVCDNAHRRFAMADGASEGSYSAEWAMRLVTAFSSSPPTQPFPPDAVMRWLTGVQQGWDEGIDWKSLPWYAGQKASAGAFAAFLGVELVRRAWRTPHPTQSSRGGNENWRAVAIGDTCLFHVHRDALTRAFPIRYSRSFTHHPHLLSSNPGYLSSKKLQSQLRVAEGDWEAGDSLIMATDAMAKWLLILNEAGKRPWETIRGMQSQTEFEELVTRLRQSGEIADDDTTVAIISEEGSPA